MEYRESARKIDHGISLIEVNSPQEGISKAKDLLDRITGERLNNILFLSGGSTPGPLYEELARDKGFRIAEYFMIDERYGQERHPNSNEKMIIEAGLDESRGLHPILDDQVVGLEATAEEYDRCFASLAASKKDSFGKWIAVMGIGSDGHTAGIPAGIKNSSVRQAQDKMQNYVESIRDFPGEFKERVTLTFSALAQMDVLLILAFGQDKRKALLKMLAEGSLEEIPARFYAQPEIAKKTILITDQKGLE